MQHLSTFLNTYKPDQYVYIDNNKQWNTNQSKNQKLDHVFNTINQQLNEDKSFNNLTELRLKVSALKARYDNKASWIGYLFFYSRIQKTRTAYNQLIVNIKTKINAKHLEELDLSHIENLTLNELKLAVKDYPRLKTLRLPASKSANIDNCYHEIVHAFPLFEKVVIADKEVFNSQATRQSQTTLKIPANCNLTWSEFQAALDCRPKLFTLHLKNAEKLYLDFTHPILNKVENFILPTNLKEINIVLGQRSRVDVIDNILAQNQNTLQAISISGTCRALINPSTSQSPLKYFSINGVIAHPELMHGYHIASPSFCEIIQSQSKQRKSAYSLFAAGNTFAKNTTQSPIVNNRDLRRWLKPKSALKVHRVDLFGCSQITDEAFNRIPKLEGIHALDLRGTGVSRAKVEYLRRENPKVQIHYDEDATIKLKLFKEMQEQMSVENLAFSCLNQDAQDNAAAFQEEVTQAIATDGADFVTQLASFAATGYLNSHDTTLLKKLHAYKGPLLTDSQKYELTSVAESYLMRSIEESNLEEMYTYAKACKNQVLIKQCLIIYALFDPSGISLNVKNELYDELIARITNQNQVGFEYYPNVLPRKQNNENKSTESFLKEMAQALKQSTFAARVTQERCFDDVCKNQVLDNPKNVAVLLGHFTENELKAQIPLLINRLVTNDQFWAAAQLFAIYYENWAVNNPDTLNLLLESFPPKGSPNTRYAVWYEKYVENPILLAQIGSMPVNQTSKTLDLSGFPYFQVAPILKAHAEIKEIKLALGLGRPVLKALLDNDELKKICQNVVDLRLKYYNDVEPRLFIDVNRKTQFPRLRYLHLDNPSPTNIPIESGNASQFILKYRLNHTADFESLLGKEMGSAVAKLFESPPSESPRVQDELDKGAREIFFHRHHFPGLTVDAKIKTKSGIIPAHQYYLSTLGINQELIETKLSRAAVEWLLEYAYTEQMPTVTYEIAKELIYCEDSLISEKIKKSLQQVMEHQLIKLMTKENVLDIYDLAIQKECPILKLMTRMFIEKNCRPAIPVNHAFDTSEYDENDKRFIEILNSPLDADIAERVKATFDPHEPKLELQASAIEPDMILEYDHIQAHRIVLARLPYFSAWLNYPNPTEPATSNENDPKIDAAIIGFLLEYIYKRTVPTCPPDQLPDLLYLSQEWGLDSLNNALQKVQ